MPSSAKRPAAVLIAALAWAPINAQHSVPGCADVQPSDFRKTSFIDKSIHPGLAEPIKMVFARDGRFFWMERPGAVKRWDPATRAVTQLIQLNVYLENTRGGMGITLDPGFASNNWMYVVYIPKIPPYNLFRLSRFTLAGDKLQDEKIVLDVPITAGYGQHASGALAWDNDGNLLWGLGDNSQPGNYAAISATNYLDSRRTSASSDNLNGKILRIKPTADGKYAIPAGNMFAPGTAKTRPEIYAMGFRNPWTLWYDKPTGWLIEGEVGADAGAADANQGPAAQEELNLIRDPGFYGWPYLAGHNLSYKVNGQTFDPGAIKNDSPNSTGLRDLPPARPALLAWGHDNKSQDQIKWPVMGGNDGTGMVGAMYRYDPALASRAKLPPHFDGTVFFSDWELGWLLAADLDSAGAVTDVKKPFGNTQFLNPIAMTIGPDGALYVIEYDHSYFTVTSGQKISKVEYVGSCSPSVAVGPRPRPDRAARPHLEARLGEGRIMWITGGRPAVDAAGRR
jgi:glucose/arabinose dehydrogenase